MPRPQRFKSGDTVKAFVKLGVQRECHWTKMEYVKRRGGAYVVKFHDQECSVSPEHIRGWKPLDDRNAAITKLDEGFPELVKYVERAVKELLPEKWQGVKVDHDEKIITLTASGMTIEAGIVETVNKSILGETCVEVAAWTVCSVHHVPATREDPPDCDIVDEGYSITTWGGAELIVRKTWEFNSARLWEAVGEEQMAAEYPDW